MLRPEEVPDVPDEERARMFAECERAIDEQLSHGLKQSVCTVTLPDNRERLIRDLIALYNSAGWEVVHPGANLLEFRRGQTCRGSWALGNNCKTCWRCRATDRQRKA